MRTTAIVAAFNEEKTIAHVLGVLSTNPLIDEVIVVSDGSTDRTVEIARTFDVRTIALRENQGKGYAMRVGTEYASNDNFFFCDADMFVTHEHIEALVRPVVAGECDMNIGVRHRGPFLNFFHLRLKCGPVLSGIRVLTRAVWDTVPQQYMERFKIEAALNFFCARSSFRQQHTIIYDLGHVTKESKRGVWEGLLSRGNMSSEVTLMLLDLYLFETWRWSSSEEELPAAEYDLFE